MVDATAVRFFFDYVDPLSYLVELQVREAEGLLRGDVERVPFELRPPPAPMLDPDDADWRRRWEEARSHGRPMSVELTPPPIVPWTRKAHELVLYARDHALGAEAHELVFERAVRQGVDIGRIDILVQLAVDLGLDRTETKAVLDVDRHAASIVRAREEGAAAGVLAPPTLVRGAAVLRGFHNATRIVKFLGSF